MNELIDAERAVYEWQMWVPDFGEAGQRALKNSSVMISRTGGLGGTVAYYLAAAGVGRLILAHGGNVVPSDLNRQLLMTSDWIGKSRIESATRRLRELNPRIEIEAVAENVNTENASRLVASADVVVDCAPLFEERFHMNRETVRHGKPMIECAMYELQAQVTTIFPRKTACLACLYPEEPAAWKRQFPVFGAVSGMVAGWGAMEAIKVLSGLGEVLAGRMLMFDMRTGMTREVTTVRNPICKVCGD